MLGPHRRNRSEAALHNKNDPPPHIPEGLQAPQSPADPRIIVGSPTSGSTPPKKTWERHYRSFLTKRTSSSSDQLHQAPVSPGGRLRSETSNESSSGPHVHSNSHRSSKFSLVPGSKRLLTRQAPDKHASAPTMPVLAKTRWSGDMTVKGGNFFSHVFHKDQSRSKSPSPIVARKIKSMDALDSTVRRGQEKSYSPNNLRFVHTELDVAAGPPTPSLASTSTVSTPHGSPLPLHPSSPRGSRTAARLTAVEMLPKALTASAKKASASTEIKKAFTEFHNSASFARDSTSAYLGDDTSATGNTYFAMYNQMATHHKDCKLPVVVGLLCCFARII